VKISAELEERPGGLEERFACPASQGFSRGGRARGAALWALRGQAEIPEY